jgi:isohexenylglutaconyl-CoA hydratase
LKPAEATRLGLAHIALEAGADIDAEMQQILTRVRRCEPTAVAATKRLVDRAGSVELGSLLDEAAAEFSTLVRRPEAKAGMTAFLTRKPAPWDQED